MAQAGSLIWLVVGASLVGVVTRVTIPPATWLALTFLLHASRSMPAVPGLPYVWLALYVAAGDWQSRHPSGIRSRLLRDRRLYRHDARRFRSPSIGSWRPGLAASDRR